MTANTNVVVLGATDDPLKYSYRAVKMLQEKGHNPIPVNPARESIDGIKVYPSLRDVGVPIDTISIYVRPSISSEMTEEILAARPRRVIMNPGTENRELADRCEQNGIQVIRGCTLVMLQTNQF